ncbi:histidinol-phosphate transaminase [Streptomyces olivaceus]|uniref:histidinol-phosphate transaminase n=1 Tax=Streptomyces olivaceus TaxID=47716 RepID=UPI000877F210|nr:histidinol-phosphate transaminase [Streptomyces olivaceus]AOW88288.1 aminotransferase [Streptomyces olivaceus]MBZ6204953.1 histidinol-phosphate transaminase [Streptomyces olivaceus]
MSGLRTRATLHDLVPAFVRTPDPSLIQLAANEAAYGPLPSVAEALARQIGQVNRYPDDGAVGLRHTIADWLGVEGAEVALGAGSLGLLEQVMLALCDQGSEVVHPWRSFDVYPQLISMAGATPRPVPLREERNDLEGMLASIGERTRVVIVCNPNNPTGPAIGRSELEGFLRRLPRSVTVLLDEAYFEYVRDPAVPDGLTLLRDHPNLAVLRTFSKAYGLAALRVGYLVARREVVEAVDKTHVTYSVSRLAQAAALASIDAQEELGERIEATVRERGRVRDTLLSQGWRVPVSEGNFVWLRLGAASQGFGKDLERFGVAVKVVPDEGVRMTIGTREENDVFLEAAGAVREAELSAGG